MHICCTPATSKTRAEGSVLVVKTTLVFINNTLLNPNLMLGLVFEHLTFFKPRNKLFFDSGDEVLKNVEYYLSSRDICLLW